MNFLHLPRLFVAWIVVVCCKPVLRRLVASRFRHNRVFFWILDSLLRACCWLGDLPAPSRPV